MSVSQAASAVANNGATSATTNVDYTVPNAGAGGRVGQVALAAFGVNNNLTVNTVPTGWQLLFGPINQSTTFSGFLYYKVLLSSDIGNLARWVLSASQRPTGVMELLNGVDVAQFLANIDAGDVKNNNGAAGGTGSAPQVTTRVDSTWVQNFWLARVASQTAGPSITVPGTHTAQSISSTAFAVAGIQTSARSGRLTTPGAPGNFGAYTATFGSTANYVSFSVSLPPGPPGPLSMISAAIGASLR